MCQIEHAARRSLARIVRDRMTRLEDFDAIARERVSVTRQHDPFERSRPERFKGMSHRGSGFAGADQ